MRPYRDQGSLAAFAAGAIVAFVATPSARAQCSPQASLASSRSLEWEQFGRSVALYADRIAVGASLSPGSLGAGRFTRAGAVYPFRYENGVWDPDQPIDAHDAERGDQFGHSVALDRDRLVVGTADADAAYIYAAPAPGGDEWRLEAQIEGAGPGFASVVEMTTGADGAQRVIIGSPGDPTLGSVIILRRDLAGWMEEARLLGDVPGEAFGVKFVADGDRIAIASGPFGDEGGVRIYERFGAEWRLTAELKEPPSLWAPYGGALALRGDVLAVNQTFIATHPTPAIPPGRVFIYRRDGAGWTREAVLNDDGSRGDWYFGMDVAFVGEMLAVTDSSGTIQLYAPDEGVWQYIDGIRPSGDFLSRVAGDRNSPARLLASDPYSGFRHRGAAYLYSMAACYCRADLTRDGELDFLDFLTFQSLFVAGDPQADFDDSGVLDFFDFLAFQDQFAAGCP